MSPHKEFLQQGGWLGVEQQIYLLPVVCDLFKPVNHHEAAPSLKYIGVINNELLLLF